MDHLNFIKEKKLRALVSNAETEKVLDELVRHLAPLEKRGWKEKLWYREVLTLRAQWRRNAKTQFEGQDKSRLIDENLLRILDEMEHPDHLKMAHRWLLKGGKKNPYFLAAQGIVGLIGLVLISLFYYHNFVVKKDATINREDCWIITGHRTSLLHAPEFTPTTIATLPSLKEYQVLEIRFEERTEKPYFRIEDKKLGISGWVNTFGLQKIAANCPLKPPPPPPDPPKTYSLILDDIDLSFGPINENERNYRLVFRAKVGERERTISIPGRLSDYIRGLGDDQIIELGNVPITGIQKENYATFYLGLDASAERAATNQAAIYLKGDVTLIPEVMTIGKMTASGGQGSKAFRVGYRYRLVEE